MVLDSDIGSGLGRFYKDLGRFAFSADKFFVRLDIGRFLWTLDLDSWILKRKKEVD